MKHWGLIQFEIFNISFGLLFYGHGQRPKGTPVRKIWMFHPFFYRYHHYCDNS